MAAPQFERVIVDSLVQAGWQDEAVRECVRLGVTGVLLIGIAVLITVKHYVVSLWRWNKRS